MREAHLRARRPETADQPQQTGPETQPQRRSMERYDLGDHLQAGNALLTAAAGHQPAAARSAPGLDAASSAA